LGNILATKKRAIFEKLLSKYRKNMFCKGSNPILRKKAFLTSLKIGLKYIAEICKKA